jgi:hypothetical protein
MLSRIREVLSGSVLTNTELNVATAVGGGALLLLIGILFRQQPKKETDKENMSEIKLLDLESTSLMMMTPSITTVDFFEGDVSAAVLHLRTVLTSILTANPWLNGTLVRDKISNRILLRWSKDTSIRDHDSAIFSEAEDAAVISEESVPYEVLSRTFSRFAVPSSGACVDASPVPPPLFRVTLVRTPHSTRHFAVVVSMCHVIADGATFYMVRAMLGFDSVPRSLRVERYHSFSSALPSLIGAGNDSFAWLTSIGATFGILRTLLFGKSAVALVAPVANTWLTSQKEKWASSLTASEKEISFVSANDIITSTLFRNLRSDVGFMSVNFRGRVAALTTNDAGNYEALVAYQIPDFSNPALLRQSLQQKDGSVRRVHGDCLLPGAIASALWIRTALVSTWATFFTELKLPGAKVLRHLPIIDTNTVPMTDIAIIFRPRVGEIAVLLLSRTLGQERLETVLTGLEASLNKD